MNDTTVVGEAGGLLLLPRKRSLAWIPPAIFVSWVAISMTLGIDGPLRYGFPAGALIVALFLIKMSPGLYLSFAVWLWFLTPFVRRVVDNSLGWAEPSITLLAPYLAAGIALFPLISRLARPSVTSAFRPRQLFAPVFLLPLFGIMMGVISGLFHYAPGAVFAELLNWAIPITFSWYVAVHPERWTEFYDAFALSFHWILAVVGGYGIYQFIVAPPWDVFWMANVNVNTLGQPLPFQIRDFSTMNSPAVLGLAIVIGIVFWLSSPTLWGTLGVIASAIALVLSQVRTAWVVFVLAVALLMRLTTKDRVRLLTTLAGVLLVGISLFVFVGNRDSIQEDILQRVSTVGSISHDESADDRMKGYRTAFALVTDQLMGYGLGAPDTLLKTGELETSLHDNVIAAAFLELGVIGGIAYLAGIAVLMSKFCLSWWRLRSRASLTISSVGMPLVLVLYLASTVVGPTGMLTWMLVGLLLCESGELVVSSNTGDNQPSTQRKISPYDCVR